MEKTVLFWDETLRDGQQAPGLWFTKEEVIDLVHLLDEAKIDFIDLGFPIVSDTEFKTIKSITRKGLSHAETVATARALKSDIDTAKRSGVDRVAIFAPTSDILIKNKFNKNRKYILKIIEDSIKYAIKKGMKVAFIAEDSTRTDEKFLINVYERAYYSGADIIIFADTVGTAHPDLIKEVITTITNKFKKNDVIIGIHAHNDLGLATANTLAAVQSGSELVTGTFNGIGERAGNAPIEEVAVALKILFNYDFNLDLKYLYKICKKVERYSFPLSLHKPIVGMNMFRHESGIHVSAIINNIYTYQLFKPDIIGYDEIEIVIGKHSGRKALSYVLNNIGISLSDSKLEKLLLHIKNSYSKQKKDKLYKFNKEYYIKIKDIYKGFSAEDLIKIVGEIIEE